MITTNEVSPNETSESVMDDLFQSDDDDLIAMVDTLQEPEASLFCDHPATFRKFKHLINLFEIFRIEFFVTTYFRFLTPSLLIPIL